MYTRMPMKEALAPYIQKDQVAGRMFDGVSFETAMLVPTVVVSQTAGGEYKTPLKKLSDFEKILKGTFDYTAFNEAVTTHMGTIDGPDFYIPVSYVEGEFEEAPTAENTPEGMVYVPVFFKGAYDAVKLKYEVLRIDFIRSYTVK